MAALQDRAAAEGDAVELSCLVQLDVDVPVTVKWFHGRQLVTNSDDYSQVGKERSRRSVRCVVFLVDHESQSLSCELVFRRNLMARWRS